MSQPPAPFEHHDPAAVPLFAWRGDEVVLFAEQAEGRWIVARGWLHGDRLVDVRRWFFPTPGALAGQIRRLAREATGNQTLAAGVAAAALAWAEPLARGARD